MKEKVTRTTSNQLSSRKNGSNDVDVFPLHVVLNDEFERYLQTKKLHRPTLNGMLVYNVIALPAFIYRDIYQKHDLLSGTFGLFGQLFLCTVLLVHILFFMLYHLETKNVDNLTERERNRISDRRVVVINMYVIASLCACGLVMNAKVPFTYCFAWIGEGMIPLEPLIISCFLSVYHHFLFPVKCWVAILAWALQLCLIVNSSVPFASPRTAITNGILIIFYISTLALNNQIRRLKADDCLAEVNDRRSEEEKRIKIFDLHAQYIGEYLFPIRSPTSVSVKFSSHDHDGRSADVKDDVSAITLRSSDSDAPLVENRPTTTATRRFLVREKPL